MLILSGHPQCGARSQRQDRWFPTLVAAGNPNIIDEPKKGKQVGDRTFKVPLDRSSHQVLPMTNRVSTLAAAAAFVVSVASSAGVASAMPFADALAIKQASPSGVDTVRWHCRGWVHRAWAGRRSGRRWSIGGALAAPRRYDCGYSGPYYPYGYACGPNYRFGW
jgi:hypothetical protein